jgi:hypothetical protein
MTVTAELAEPLASAVDEPRGVRTNRDIARTMTLPDGPYAGMLWDPESEPIQRVFIARLDQPRWRRWTLVTPSQRGKSLMGIALPMVRTLTELTQNVAYVMPNLEKLTQAWEAKVRPLIVGCGYGAWLPEKGPGSRGGRPSALTLRNPKTRARAGTLFFMAASGGGKETSLASVTARLAAADEGDDFESAAHLKLAEKRTAAFQNEGQFIAVSTVNDRRGRAGHPILDRYRSGTRTRLWFQCPHCAGTGEFAGFQVLDPESVVYEALSAPAAVATARYRCDYCAVLWTSDDHRRALASFLEVHDGQSVDAAGRVIGPEPEGDHYSLMATDLEWNMASLGAFAEDHWSATEALRERGDHSLMRQHYHKLRCEDYTADLEELELGHQLTWQGLLRRSQECPWGPSIHTTDKTEAGDGYFYSRHAADPPPEAEWCMAGVDVQQNRVYPTLIAGNRQGTTWDMAWSYQYARLDHMPWSEAELHALLSDTYLWLVTCAGNLPLTFAGFDVGDFGEHIWKWLDQQKGGVCKGMKGTGQVLKPEPGDVDGIICRRDRLYHVNVDNTRELVQAAYRRPSGEPGSGIIPRGLSNNPSDRAYLQHLVAEMQIADPKTKKVRLRQGPGRWDWLDARRMAYALNRLHLSNLTRPKSKRKYGTIGTVGGAS